MRSPLTTIIRFVIGLLNVLLGIAFFVLGVVGVLLLTNKDFLQKFTNNFCDNFLNGATKEQANEMVQFVLKTDVPIPAIFMAVGFIIAVLCGVGFFSTCCSCNHLLKFYAAIMTVIIIAQVITTGVIFGVPNLYRNVVFRGLEKTLSYYNPDTPEGRGPARLWDLIMEAKGDMCCGMTGAADFEKTPYNPKCPSVCCNTIGSCDIKTATQMNPPVKGCRDKIAGLADDYMKRILVILIVVIVTQTLLVLLTCVALKYKTASPI